MQLLTILVARGLLRLSIASAEAGAAMLEGYHEGRYLSPLWPVAGFLAALYLVAGGAL